MRCRCAPLPFSLDSRWSEPYILVFFRMFLLLLLQFYEANPVSSSVTVAFLLDNTWRWKGLGESFNPGENRTNACLKTTKGLVSQAFKHSLWLTNQESYSWGTWSDGRSRGKKQEWRYCASSKYYSASSEYYSKLEICNENAMTARFQEQLCQPSIHRCVSTFGYSPSHGIQPLFGRSAGYQFIPPEIQ